MLAAITGASGLVGGNLAVALANAGHTVRATKRANSRVKQLEAVPIEWVDADLDDRASLARAFAGADAVFHCAALVSVRKKPTAALIKTNVDGTRNVLDAVREAGVKRLVHCSTVAAIGLSDDGRPCDETAPWNFAERGMDDGYATTKYQSQRLVEDAVRAGMDAVIVNPTFMFGPYDARPSSGELIVQIAKRKVPGWSDGGNNFVDVRDVVRGMILAWEKGRAGERYILGGHNTRYRDILNTIARIVGVPPPRWRIPRSLATIGGWFGDVREWLTDGDPRLNTMTVRYAYSREFQFSSDKAVRELGYTISPIEPAITDAVAWLRANGTM